MFQTMGTEKLRRNDKFYRNLDSCFAELDFGKYFRANCIAEIAK